MFWDPGFVADLREYCFAKNQIIQNLTDIDNATATGQWIEDFSVDLRIAKRFTSDMNVDLSIREMFEEGIC